MSISRIASLAWLSLAVAAGADVVPSNQPTEVRLLKETWEAAFLDGKHVGYVHRQFRELKYGERTVVEGVIQTDMALLRFGQPVRLQSLQAMHENPLGKLRAFVLREGVGPSRLHRKGQVTGSELVWQVQLGNKAPTERRAPWTDSALGLFAQEQLLRSRGVGAPAEIAFERFEPVFDAVVRATISPGAEEVVAFTTGEPRRLRKHTLQLDAQQTQEAPPEFWWIDEEGECWRRQVRLPLLGELICERTTAERAKKVTDSSHDVGRSQLVRVARPLPRTSELREAVFRLQLANGKGNDLNLPEDEQQSVRSIAPEIVEIRVHGLRRPPVFRQVPVARPARLPEQYLQANTFISSDDPAIRRQARELTGLDSDPWHIATRIEAWVHRNLRSHESTDGFATATEVLRRRAGDCKGHAILAAALCRAAGVPARIAVGLVYVPREQAFGFHMWLEVWVEGNWYALDPTLGRGSVPADRIKVLDHHLNHEESFAPMLPIARLAGRMNLEVVRTDATGRGPAR